MAIALSTLATPSSGVPAGVVAITLVAAVLHAVWNAIAHAVPDRLVGFALIGVAYTVIGGVTALVVGLPPSGAWPFILGSAVLHVIYLVFSEGYAATAGDVLVRHESMGPDQYEMSEDELSVVGVRSGDTISLGDRVAVVIEDVAILRRAVYAKRIVPDAVLEALKGESGEKPRPRDGSARHASPRAPSAAHRVRSRRRRA